MKKSVLVIGVGRFGTSLIESLYELGHEVFAVDFNENALNDVRDKIVSGAIINVSENDDELSKIVDKKNFDIAVVSMGNDFEGTLLATNIIIEAGIPMYTKATTDRRGNILKKMGVDQVIFPERDSGRRVAYYINNSHALDILDLPQGYMVEQMKVGEGFDGKSIMELGTNKRLGITILLIYHNEISFMPQGSSILYKGDTIVLFGQKENVLKLEMENSKI
ncbi:MAG: TrkA family potassium uptake protein [Syntrophomonas sp.]|nr:TrkA family potassium uptake protein [Syntrophomonas sp.]